MTVLNHQYHDVPHDVKEGMLAATLKVRGLEFNEKELVDLVQALDDEQKLIIKNAFGFLAKHRGALSALKTLSFK